MERFSGRFWAWLDREEFLVPKNVLDIVAGQTVTWMGLFYCPLLPLLNSVFIFLTFYIKKVRAARGQGGARGAPGWAGLTSGSWGAGLMFGSCSLRHATSLPGPADSSGSAKELTPPTCGCLLPSTPS